VTRLPLVYDGLSARIAQRVGFPILALTGNAVAGSAFGLPDVGLVSMSESVEHAGRLARCLDVPLLADADTGYGGPVNVVRTTREFEAAGVAGIILEDQVTPKRCGILPQAIPVVSRGEHVQKIRAAVEARRSRDFLVIARTDAKSMHGLEEAAGRARAYVEAGADAALVVGVGTPDELRQVAGVVRAPLVVLIHEAGPTTELTDDLLDEAGCAFAFHAGTARYAVVKTLHHVLSVLRRDGGTRACRDAMATFEEYNAAVGLAEWLALEERYRPG
jgi:2-methylisocitrate lyase-like PEP mutase family enzyme